MQRIQHMIFELLVDSVAHQDHVFFDVVGGYLLLKTMKFFVSYFLGPILKKNFEIFHFKRLEHKNHA